MIRRQAIQRLLILSGTVAAAGSLLTGWEYRRLHKSPDWTFFAEHETLLAELAETILPATDTPGAKATGVPAFIGYMVKTGLDVKSQNNFIDGLRDLAGFCQSKFGKPFEQCSPPERAQVLTHFEDAVRPLHPLVGKVKIRLAGKPFFTSLRDLTIIGYCTSEAGATQGLAYDYVPGGCESCLPYVNGQKSWATQ